MKEKNRLRLKKNLALLLVLSMLFGLSTAVYATEGKEAPEIREDAEGVSDGSLGAEEVLYEAETAEDAVTDEAVNTGAKDFKECGITVSLNTTGMHIAGGDDAPNPEQLSYYGDDPSLFADARKYVGATAKVDFSITGVSGNGVDAVPFDLIKDRDYKFDYYFNESTLETEEIVPVKITEDYVINKTGFVTVSINGIGDYTGEISLSYAVESLPSSIDKESVSLNVAKDHVTVKNMTDKKIYVYAVRSGDLTVLDRRNFSDEGIEIDPKGDTVLWQAFTKGWDQGIDGEKTVSFIEEPFIEGVKYELAVSEESLFTPDEGKSTLFEFIPLGGESELMNVQDGKFINFKATLAKNTQKISLSWNPSKDKEYKKFVLKRLNKDGKTFDAAEGWSGQLTKKSFSLKTAETGDKPPVFLLECYKKDSTKPDGQYITVVSPVLYSVTTGREPKDADYCFSNLYEDNAVTYTVWMGEDARFSSKDLETFSTYDLGDGGFYQINKTLSANVFTCAFNSNYEDVKAGDKFFHKVTANYEFQGVSYSSEDSNVVTRMTGLQKVDIFNINGVNDPAKMDEYLTEMMANNEAEEGGCEFPETSSLSDCFVHKYDEGPDAKHGYVVFTAPKATNLKGYELLMADSLNGNYKKLKLYKTDAEGNPAKNSGLSKWDYSGKTGNAYQWLKDDELQVYYAEYNKFYPGETKYYAVRAVDKKNNSSGVGDAYECTAELDGVWDACAIKTNQNKNVSLYWTHDESAAFYRIYRTEYKDDEDFDVDLDSTLIATVKNTKAGTLPKDRTRAKKTEKELVDYLEELVIPASIGGEKVKRDEEFEGSYNKFTDKDKKLDAGKDYSYVIEPVLKKDGDLDDTIDKAAFATTKKFENEEQFEAVKTAAYMGLFSKKTTKKQTRLNVYIKTASVKVSKDGLAELKWQPSDKKLSGGLRYRIEYCVINGATKNPTWYNIQGTGAGNWTWRTDWSDKAKLRRGAIKKYRITPMLPIAGDKVLLGKTKVIGQVAFPDKIELKVGKSTIKPGETTTVKVYAKRNQNPRGVTYHDIDLEYDAEFFTVSKRFVSKGSYWVVTVKAKNKTGTSRIRMTAKANSYATGTAPSQKVDMKVKK